MTWHFYALQRLSDRLSRPPQVPEGALGVVAFRLGSWPSEAGRTAIRIVERDQSLVDDPEESHEEESADDPLGTLHAEVADGQPRFEAAVEDVAAEGAELAVKVLLTGEADAPAERTWRVKVPQAARADDADARLEIGLLADGEAWQDQVPVRVQLHADFAWDPIPTVDPAREWSPSSGTPHPTESEPLALNGYPIEMVGRQPKVRLLPNGGLVSFHGTSGLVYMGRNRWSCLDDAIAALADEHTAAGEHYQAVAARAFDLLREGRVSAINSWDDRIVTLGMGYAQSRLSAVFARLEGRARELLAEALTGDHGLNSASVGSDGAVTLRAITGAPAREDRWNTVAYSRFLQLAESRQFAFDFARANLAEFIQFNCVTGATDVDLRWAQTAAMSGLPLFRTMVAVGGYLKQGRSAYRNPLGDVRVAMTQARRTAGIYGIPEEQAATASAQLAVLLKLHVEYFEDAAERVTRKLLERALGRKFEVFTEGVRQDMGPRDWSFQLPEAKRIIPCLVDTLPDDRSPWIGMDLWEGTRTRPPEGHVSVHVGGRYYDFGPRLRPDEED